MKSPRGAVGHPGRHAFFLGDSMGPGYVDREWLFDALVSGSFEGSPVRLEHSLVIEDGKIAHLDI